MKIVVCKAVAALAALLIVVPVDAASAEFNGSHREWATSNGASWDGDLEEAAVSVSRGGPARPLPEGSIEPWSRGVFGYATLSAALAALGEPPAAGTLVAAHSWSSNGSWGAGYVTVVGIESLPPTRPTEPKRPTRPKRPTEPETEVEEEVEQVDEVGDTGGGSDTTVPAVVKEVDEKVEVTYTTADEAKASTTPVLVAREDKAPSRSSTSMWLILPMGVAVFVAFMSRQKK